MAALTGSTIASTYLTLLKLTDASGLGSGVTAKYIEDAAGTDSALSLSQDRVGIGTSAPEGNLHILSGSAGTVSAHSDADELVVEGSGNTGISVLCPDGSVSELVLGSDDDSLGAAVQWSDSNELMTITTHLTGGDIRFITGAGTPETMRMLQSGNIGIGTDAPGSLLHLKDDTATDPALILERASSDSLAGPEIEFRNQESDGFLDDNEVCGKILFRAYDTTGGDTGYHTQAMIRSQVDGTHANNDFPGDLIFSTNAGGTGSSDRIQISESGWLGPVTDNSIDLGHASFRFDDVYATNASIQTSDEREKESIANSSLGLDFINKLLPKSYKWKDKTLTHTMYNGDEKTTYTEDKKHTRTHYGLYKNYQPR
jgi:hypothetical protein